MANTYTQITIHLVFAVQNRDAFIKPDFKDRLYKYIIGILSKQGQKMLAINGMPDHIHILFGMTPTACLSNLVRDLKSDSSKFINENKLSKFKFQWQEGFSAFSYSRSERDHVIKYIINQEAHHSKKTFMQEYLKMLKEFKIDYNDKYLYKFID